MWPFNYFHPKHPGPPALIARAWLSFSATNMPARASVEQRYEMRRAYFAGAGAAAMLLIHGTPTLRILATIEKLAAESDAHARDHQLRINQYRRKPNA